MNITFLDTVLGINGSQAIQRAVSNNPSFANILVPRVLLSWVNNIANYGFEGRVPGAKDTFLVLEKTDNGFEGAVTIEEKLYTFNNSSPMHVAAAIGIAINSKLSSVEELNKNDLLQLGKSIDALVKTNLIKSIQEQYLATLDYGEFIIEYTGDVEAPYLVKHEPTDKIVADKLTKVEHAKTIAETADFRLSSLNKSQETAADYKYRVQHPHQPHADKRYEGKKISKFKPKKGVPAHGGGAVRPRLKIRRHLKPRKASLKLSEEDMGKVCSECGGKMFKSEEFVGCMCLSDLSQFITLQKNETGRYLDFSPEMLDEDIEVIYEIIREF
jgi:hypothetical protein